MSDQSRKDGVGEPASGPVSDLRRRAEQEAAKMAAEDSVALTVEEARRLLHELRTHQIELEMQNEELRRTQVALDVARARYFDLYDLAPVGYVTVSERGSILEANLRASTMLGVPRTALQEQPLTRFLVSEDQDTFYRHRKELFDSGQPQVCELRMRRPDGTQLWVRLEATAARDEASGAATLRATMSDITEARELQASLAQADRMASMGFLAAGVAHEISNPLTYVLFNVESADEDLSLLSGAVGRCREALRERVGGAELAEIAGKGARTIDPMALADLLTRVRQAAAGLRRMADIVKGLGYLSRVEQAQPSLVDVNQALEHAISMASNEVRCRAVLVRHLDHLPGVLAVEGKLVQAFLNLIVNAAHSIAEGAVVENRITLRTWAEADHVFVEVADTGHGILPEHMSSIFEPFFTTKGPDRGTGLGLAIARRIVSELGGDIHVESRVGEGSRFKVRVPAGRVEPEAASPLPVDPLSTEAHEVRLRILVVDDEEMICRIVARMLEAEHEIVTAGSGREAMDILGTDREFDLILCDVMMPDVAGIDLHVWLTEHDRRLAQQTVFISGGMFSPRASEYLERISNKLVRKPFDAKILRETVREVGVAARERR